jgi:hypothetical protein
LEKVAESCIENLRRGRGVLHGCTCAFADSE